MDILLLLSGRQIGNLAEGLRREACICSLMFRRNGDWGNGFLQGYLEESADLGGRVGWFQ